MCALSSTLADIFPHKLSTCILSNVHMRSSCLLSTIHTPSHPLSTLHITLHPRHLYTLHVLHSPLVVYSLFICTLTCTFSLKSPFAVATLPSFPHYICSKPSRCILPLLKICLTPPILVIHPPHALCLVQQLPTCALYCTYNIQPIPLPTLCGPHLLQIHFQYDFITSTVQIGHLLSTMSTSTPWPTSTHYALHPLHIYSKTIHLLYLLSILIPSSALHIHHPLQLCALSTNVHYFPIRMCTLCIYPPLLFYTIHTHSKSSASILLPL